MTIKSGEDSAKDVAAANRDAATCKRPIRQNWILSPQRDMCFILLAPVFVLALLLWLSQLTTALTVFAIVGIYNIAHHLPTLLRIYGDRDLFRRYRWRFLLAPLLPFFAFVAVAGWLLHTEEPIDNVLFLLMILTLWAPWHLMMQHYGFLRIYDRHNQAPHRLQTRMELGLCLSWFAYLLLAMLDWFPDLIYRLYTLHGVSALNWFVGVTQHSLQRLTFTLAMGMSLVYVGYVFWCARRGYFVSYAKLVLNATTFAVLYLAMVPNHWMAALQPNWNYALGFLVLNATHNTQYFAIVWRFNRGLAQGNSTRVRGGLFHTAFARGGLAVLAVYLLACLVYGLVLGRGWVTWLTLSPATLQAALIVLYGLAFTSELLHYYFDGFIWKVRHRENVPYLSNAETEPSQSNRRKSWWDNQSDESLLSVFLKQGLYFLVPIMLLTATFLMWRREGAEFTPMRHLIEARTQQDFIQAVHALDQQIDIEKRMIALQPRAVHLTYLSEMLFLKAHLVVMRKGGRITVAERDDYSTQIQLAIETMEQALSLPPPYEHREFIVKYSRPMTRSNIETRILEMKQQLQLVQDTPLDGPPK